MYISIASPQGIDTIKETIMEISLLLLHRGMFCSQICNVSGGTFVFCLASLNSEKAIWKISVVIVISRSQNTDTFLFLILIF